MIRKKLIEVSIPLEAINVASAREKSIRHGHPSTLHLWWARRAVLFAQLVDDPSAWPDRYPFPEIANTEDGERKRLHRIIERMVPWEASNDERILNEARWEIARSVAWGLGEEPPPPGDGPKILDYLQTKAPPVYDPFCGGGSIPLEAQRLGLRAYGSDLNPVAVLISKALVEIPPKFAGLPPVNPDAQAALRAGGNWNGKGAQGLAEDVRHYGRWMRDEAEKRIGCLYPKAQLPDGTQVPVIAWLWARTVICPNPACRCEMPLITSFVLSSKKGNQRYLAPRMFGKQITFDISDTPPEGIDEPSKGFKRGISGVFQCAFCGNVTTRNYVAEQGKAHRLGQLATAVVAEGEQGRLYLSADSAPLPLNLSIPDTTGLEVLLSPNPRDVWCRNFGLDTPASLFTSRQLVALTTFSDLVREAQRKVSADARVAGLEADGATLHAGGTGASAYADAIATYLGLVVSRLADRSANVCSWDVREGQGRKAGIRNVFSRQAIAMAWDFAEANPLSDIAASVDSSIGRIADVLLRLPRAGDSYISLIDAAKNSFPVRPVVISTDPPYYDNIGYADLSDFFYVWLRRSLSAIWPDLLRRLSTPKAEELVVTPYRHGGREEAEGFFMRGMGEALTAMGNAATDNEPLGIYYAFKQSELAEEGIISAGWASFLQAAVDAGLTVDGTWPVRTELANRMIAKDTNALASSIVLVCRKRATGAATITRAELIRALKRELPEAIEDIRKAGVGPVDMQQSVVGPGMGVFTRLAKVLEDDDSTMSVRTALALINRVWEEIESELDANFDAETQVALAWFATYGFDTRASGELITLANAKVVPLGALFAAGVFKDLHGRACLMPRGELPAGWNPVTDTTATVWECVQHTARVLAAEDGGAAAAASLVARMGPKAREARLLAERLYLISTQKGWASEALVYNQLAQEWAHLEDVATGIDALGEPGAPAQGSLALAGGRTG
jgi:putative DNA methylase